MIVINGNIDSSISTATFIDNVADLNWSSTTGPGENSAYIGNPGDNSDNVSDLLDWPQTGAR